MNSTDHSEPRQRRSRLPDRRENETFYLDHTWGRATPNEIAETMLVTIGRAPDGEIGEVFINCDNRHNSRAIAMWHDIGVLVSIALQYGATLEELSAATTRLEVPIMDRMEVVPASPAGTLLNALVGIEKQRHTAAGIAGNV